jgi:hypothetical protein
MTTVKDSVHDHIEVTGVAAALMDTPPVQRLRRIKQLGTASLVYPSANHTRFEHSLGVYHLASRALEHLDVHGRRAETVRGAAILHDVGHGPFSHNVEDLIHRRTGNYHDDVDDLITSGAVAEALDAHEIDPDRIVDVIDGTGLLGQLVAGELDVDRMDYLVRDAHHTGVPYGTIDTQRLVRALRFVDGHLVLDEGNVQSAESLLVARALMNPTVYNHTSPEFRRRCSVGRLNHSSTRRQSRPTRFAEWTIRNCRSPSDPTTSLPTSDDGWPTADCTNGPSGRRWATWATPSTTICSMRIPTGSTNSSERSPTKPGSIPVTSSSTSRADRR